MHAMLGQFVIQAYFVKLLQYINPSPDLPVIVEMSSAIKSPHAGLYPNPLIYYREQQSLMSESSLLVY